ncbi:hypothetical protein DICPUDRAFT_35223 [Dictyostelium purpureum]|uniref:GP-PDE domain-containing protein n=1 Tax=Dictyostelium purpureum TaxID=5786 RepID=F0ZP23_DICPU|nr:uncharacterized protein DICPUDRAFT_35223 [Dictyostelium purpureum]EGC34284.1 hypothetical protein DICPUDRAFT_35223 [Dictyostelium purpureum]|eukprot:XP_003289166.1 hypothetical protein DICPUDRAFT_35223 [Dictyostelium purpureum]
MKFQKHLKSVTIWNHHYLPYQKLKRKIRNYFSPPVSPVDNRVSLQQQQQQQQQQLQPGNDVSKDFLEILENEIKKVNQFILEERLPHVLNRFEDLKQKYKSIDFSSPFSVYLSVGLPTQQQLEEEGSGSGNSTPLDQSSSSLYFPSEQLQQHGSNEVDTITAFQIAFEDILKQLAEIDQFSQLNIQAIQKLLNTYSKKKVKSTIYEQKRRKAGQSELTGLQKLDINNTNNNELEQKENHQKQKLLESSEIDSIKQQVDKFFNDKVTELELYNRVQLKKLTLEIELEYQTICQTNVRLLNNSYYDLLSIKEKELSNKVVLFCKNVISNNTSFIKNIIEEIKGLMKELKIDDSQIMWTETIHSCIHKSCYLGNVDMVKLLFSSFKSLVNVDYCDEKNKQFIHIASENGKTKVVDFLLDNGANIECGDFLSRRPLHLSSKNGHYECTELLLKRNANVNVLDREGCTPLYLACRRYPQKEEQGNLVIDASSGNAGTEKSIVDLLLLNGTPLTRGPYGRHILHEASSKGNVSNIKSIVKVDPESINLTDLFGRTPIFESVKHGNLSSIITLLENKANIVQVFDDDKRTLLHEAAANGQLDSMELLFDHITRTLNVGKEELYKISNQQDDDGWAPLHDACYLNYIQCVKCLLEHRSNPNLLDKGEWSPIVHSLYRGNIQAAITIMEFFKKNPDLLHESSNLLSPPLRDSNKSIMNQSLPPKIIDLSDLNKSINSLNSSTGTTPKLPLSPGKSDSLSSSNTTVSDSSTSTTPTPTPTPTSNMAANKKILKSLLSTVCFRVLATNIKPGHRLGIVGNRKAIGSWNPSSAIFFKEETQSAESSVWVGRVQVPVNVQLEYKYVIFEGTRLDSWEALPENRKFTPQEEDEFVDDGVFGQLPNEDVDSQAKQSIFMERGWLVQDTQLRVRFGETSSTDPQRKIIQPVILYNGKEQAGKIIVSLRDRFSNIQKGTTTSTVNLPLTKDQSVLFQTNQLKTDSYHTIQFDIYRRGMSTVLIGRAIILVSELTSTHPYKKVVPIINSSLLSVGELYFFPLIISPFTHPKVSDVLSKTYWKSTLLIGHRGGGAENARSVGKYKRTHIKENTILSFVTAASLGAQYIEFDVQLSRDGVPVIYHDFEILGKDNIKIPINKINLQQFKKLQLKKNKTKNGHNDEDEEDDSSNNNHHEDGKYDLTNDDPLHHNSDKRLKFPSLKNLRGRSKSMQDIFNDFGAISSQSASSIITNLKSSAININASFNKNSNNSNNNNNNSNNNGKSEPINDSMTTLEETFKNVPIQTGFNIEIKYPNQEKEQEIQMNNLNRNTYVDIILKVVFEHAGDRSVMFSSFDPDICLLCSLKQPKYPVFFLNNAGFTQHSDPRANSISEAIRFSKSAHLLGIVTNSKILCEAPPVIGQVKSAGLMLCSWGSENNDPALVDLQESLGCDAVIVDHVAYVSKHYNKPTNNENEK